MMRTTRMTKYGDDISGGARRRRARAPIIGFSRHFELSFYHITPAVQRTVVNFRAPTTAPAVATLVRRSTDAVVLHHGVLYWATRVQHRGEDTVALLAHGEDVAAFIPLYTYISLYCMNIYIYTRVDPCIKCTRSKLATGEVTAAFVDAKRHFVNLWNRVG